MIIFMSHQILKIISCYFLKYPFFPFIFIFLFWDSYMCMVSFITGPLGSVHFLKSFFILFPRLYHFICPIVNFANPYFCVLKYAVKYFSKIFISIIVILSLSFFFMFYITLLIFHFIHTFLF